MEILDVESCSFFDEVESGSFFDEVESGIFLDEVESGSCIYRVPVRLRNAKEDDFTPTAVSIGPLHHGKQSLKAMEENKKIYLEGFLRLTDLSPEYCFNVVKEHEARLRRCYDERTADYLGSDEFVNIILVDVVFIIEVLLRSAFKGEYPAPPVGDRVFRRPWMLQEVVSDLLLLENQVPFFILRALFDPHKSNLLPDGGNHRPDSLLKLAFHFFCHYVFFDVKRDKLEKIDRMNLEHLVHILLCLQVPLDAPQGEEWIRESPDTPSLSELHQAGVKFQRSDIDVLDVKFTPNGTLKLPTFIVDRGPAKAIRNMLAFEQCHFLHHRYLSEYIHFVNRLVSTSEDVDLLVDFEIVKWTPPDSSALISLKTSLSDGILIPTYNSHFVSLSKSLRGHVRKPWNKWKANLKQNYFNTPWASISVIAAVFIIILTLIQTVFAIISPNSK